MKVVRYPEKSEYASLLARPVMDSSTLESAVQTVLSEVKRRGDAALFEYTSRFDGVQLNKLEVSEEEKQVAANQVSPALKEAMQLAAANIRRFHQAQVQPVEIIETMPGIQCWRKSVGIEKVGLYIPGGTAPLFSTILMLGIPASIAGCKEIVLCSPPDKTGKLHPAIIYAASLVGVTRIFKVGGAQAIAAMAYGTETMPQVFKIFGPGNQYVTCAKQLVQRDGLAIDMPAGPSEVAVFADATANPAYVAADLLSQAEHGADSQVLLVTTDENLPEKVSEALKKQLEQLSRAQLAEKALQNSSAIVVSTKEEALEILNLYAAEHLILASDQAKEIADKVVNAGSVFLGHLTPESVGDYASGTNHTLPTNGYAKAYSGVSVDSFVRKITFQELSPGGLKAIGPAVVEMASAEGLDAHAKAVTIRMQNHV
ncbi:histidinol dehydrogenase [Flavihumibacter sp. RY-1]|uniref:Histidinol dehydrogenase n=1 Tax=Flavihumibacter fluminis TaxID=2909236 RepID=A0ABS9BCS0_9BACT|nr:histidinol dehydrogenase [Flavihumibacter fluminis]MCF1713473.1 histidinol dehydrogenase [Flavihumibacter fluminis]